MSTIQYADSNGVVFARFFFTYDGVKLIKLERKKRSGPGFIINKTMAFQYQADGNLSQVTDHRPSFSGQPERTYIDRYEQYDAKINVDGFGLLHNEFFDHLVFLPGIQL